MKYMFLLLRNIKLKTIFKVYQTNYEAGLRVLRINPDEPSLTELAYFDVFPSRTTADCCFGAWSNYPWLKDGESQQSYIKNMQRCEVLSFIFSDVVAVSSIDYGLFILQLDSAAIEAQKKSDVTLGEQHRYRPALAGSDIMACPPLVERRVCVPEEC